MFTSLKSRVTSIYRKFSSALGGLFAQHNIHQEHLNELSQQLLSADVGVATTNSVIQKLQQRLSEGQLHDGQQLKQLLTQELLGRLEGKNRTISADVYLIVGINGSGKTTAIGKLATILASQGKQSVIAAADTFRAAADQQISVWAQRVGAHCIVGKQGADPASVVYSSCEYVIQHPEQALIVDTAGRLQTKTNLMKELEKIKRVIASKLPDKKVVTLLTIDAMLGQNSFEQARQFKQAVGVDGVILTKMDGSAKGGIIFAIEQECSIPVIFVSYGEQLNQFKLFDPNEYISQLLE
jgi:fused signal recognition particle receptor